MLGHEFETRMCQQHCGTTPVTYICCLELELHTHAHAGTFQLLLKELTCEGPRVNSVLQGCNADSLIVPVLQLMKTCITYTLSWSCAVVSTANLVQKRGSNSQHGSSIAAEASQAAAVALP